MFLLDALAFMCVLMGLIEVYSRKMATHLPN